MIRFLLVALLVASHSAIAALNKWVDDNGEVHYSDTPPPSNVTAKKIHSAATGDDTAAEPGTSGAAPAKTMAEKQADQKRAEQAAKDAADKAAREKAQAETMKSNCANAQDNLRSLQSGLRLMEVAPNGEQSFVSDEERQKRIEKARQDISTYCK